MVLLGYSEDKFAKSVEWKKIGSRIGGAKREGGGEGLYSPK